MYYFSIENTVYDIKITISVYNLYAGKSSTRDLNAMFKEKKMRDIFYFVFKNSHEDPPYILSRSRRRSLRKLAELSIFCDLKDQSALITTASLIGVLYMRAHIEFL